LAAADPQLYISGNERGLLSSAGRYDVIHVDSIHMMRYAEFLHRKTPAKIVYNWHNVESEAMQRYSLTVTSPVRRWYARLTAAKLERLEREILQTAFGHIVCSRRESDQLKRRVPEARIAVIPNGVDMQYFAGAGTGSPSGYKLIFVGSMDYYPNAQAAISFARRIWPRIRERLPEGSLILVGANPSPSVQALAELPGVQVTGTVLDVRPYYRDALAAIVPLRTGGGTRLKILEAMAAGVPVISTPLGADGLDFTPGKDILIADPDASDEWIGHLLRLAEPSGTSRRALVDEALAMTRANYDWEILGQTLWTTYQEWLGSAD
jgi:glycosyltransferase involved in cell wall biosynthesis